MSPAADQAFVTTVKEKCRVCYTCVRECPAKAIRVRDGQAEIIPERCIACGNCVRVCTQHAKRVRNTTDEVLRLLDEVDSPVAACLAPSFPAAFPELDHQQLVGMVRALGFAYVNEVAFGGELVARRYKSLLSENNGKRYITANCPAIVEYVRRYHPELTDSLGPIVSPMVATARVLRVLHGPGLKVVFFGPCIAKKVEVTQQEPPADLDAASTFEGLRILFNVRGITQVQSPPSDFDPPHARMGGIFPLSRGMLQVAEIAEDLTSGDVIVANGRARFAVALDEFESGTAEVRLLDTLACQGCIMGPGMATEVPLFQRRYHVSHHLRRTLPLREQAQWERELERFAGLDLSRSYRPNDQRISPPPEEELCAILTRMGKRKPEDELNCGACGYVTCREHAAAIHMGLAETMMCLPHTIDELKQTIGLLANSNAQLAQVEEALEHSKTFTYFDQFAEGLAHELNNPLGVILMYINLLIEASAADSDTGKNLALAAEHVGRCRELVDELMYFARELPLKLERVVLRELIDLGIHAANTPEEIRIVFAPIRDAFTVEVDPHQIVELIRIVTRNACEAMPQGGTLAIRVEEEPLNSFTIIVNDTGVGIPNDELAKVFDPFFTGKEKGRGNGLGLANALRIVRSHGGEITLDSEQGRGCTVRICLPVRASRKVTAAASSPAPASR